jgi:hypothetical protein
LKHFFDPRRKGRVRMKTSVFFLVLAAAIFPAFALLAQSHPVHHSHTPNSPSNDLQLQLPLDQAQYCLTPESSGGFNEQFEQFDSFPQPASKGYLCINLPPGRPFVIDHLFAEADYDVELPTAAEWYLDTTV